MLLGFRPSALVRGAAGWGAFALAPSLFSFNWVGSAASPQPPLLAAPCPTDPGMRSTLLSAQNPGFPLPCRGEANSFAGPTGPLPQFPREIPFPRGPPISKPETAEGPLLSDRFVPKRRSVPIVVGFLPPGGQIPQKTTMYVPHKGWPTGPPPDLAPVSKGFFFKARNTEFYRG